jgi:hypothetical protein
MLATDVTERLMRDVRDRRERWERREEAEKNGLNEGISGDPSFSPLQGLGIPSRMSAEEMCAPARV